MSDLIVKVLGGDEFLAQDLGRAHRVFSAPAGEQNRFADLLTWPALNEILNTHRLEPPRLRLALGGETIRVEEYCEQRTYRRMQPWHAPQPHLLSAQLRKGATLVLDAIEEMHPPIRDLVSALERQLRTGVQVNAYASWTAKEGFGVHWDDHDVIVIQISGAKRWRVYGPTRPAPLYRDVDFDDAPPTTPIDEFTLRAGDVLHVPRGWWHAAAASTGQPSLHLTCGLTTHTGVDLLAWLIDELRAHEIIRTDIPRTADHADAMWRNDIAELLAERLGDPSLIEKYLTARDSAYGVHGGFSLPHAVHETLPADPDLRVALTAPRAVMRRSGENLVLEAAGQRWSLACRAEPLLEILVSGRSEVLGVLAQASDITTAQAADLLSQFLHAGILSVGERR
ncbi:cupin domain-containing protein [Actinocorallia populi]|uniref:cupin domain-containing protein n=1 Tax=Actinocorallia populi TaxID=2079200 RepID=UPI000D095F48|nr:cupin domain-containing protein [Actinocorallia populi]